MVFGGVGTYIVGGPAVHYRHRNTTGALASLGLRLLPFVAVAFAPPLAAVAVLAASVTDWFVLAKVKVGGKPQVYAAPLAGGGASLGLAGAF
jgi:hypothetical protein